MIFVLGGDGFVGSALVRLLRHLEVEHEVISRVNFASYAGRSCDILINANGNSRKFMADKDPSWEFDASVVSVVNALNTIRSGTYVHLSTGDVYPSQRLPEETLEDLVPDVAKMSRYGLHKYVAETLVRGCHKNWLIFRMGGFVGPGLKKNAIFDMLNDAPVWLDPDSELQFISTDSAARIIWSVVEGGTRNEIMNLGASGVIALRAIHKQIGSRSAFQVDAPVVRFELSIEKLRAIHGKSLPTTKMEIDAFLGTTSRITR